MFSYDYFTLPNGLRVVLQRVPSSKVAIFNLMYKVGSGDERPFQTGIAHLFEHLMFSGSKHVPNYDKALQQVGGQNNAYTTFDVTNYYCVVPTVNIETAFWLESDRMFYLSCTERQLELQRKVVIEEFNQTCYNKPYGDAWHYLLELAYTDHPYSWPTIGREKLHIEQVSLEDIYAFGKHFYTPSNAVLVVVGEVEIQQVKDFSEKWFGQGKKTHPARYTPELKAPNKRKGLRKEVKKEVPFNLLYQAYHIPGRGDSNYLSLLSIAHLLGTGKSSLLYKKLVDEKALLTDFSIYTTDMLHGGLFVIEAELCEGSSFKEVEQAIHTTIEEVCHIEINPQKWQQTKNQLESEYAFMQMDLRQVADTLAFATWLGSPDFFSKEITTALARLGAEEAQKVGRTYLQKQDALVLSYEKI